MATNRGTPEAETISSTERTPSNGFCSKTAVVSFQRRTTSASASCAVVDSRTSDETFPDGSTCHVPDGRTATR
jgi:hypothetical protein